MTGLRIQIEDQGLEQAIAKINLLGRSDLTGQLLDDAGALIASQTQERIASEKATPGGTAWPAWAPATAAMRHGGQSLLFASGALAGDIHHVVTGDEAQIGSNLVYAAIHQFGGEAGRGHKTKIPAREYLGLSNANRDELEELIDDFYTRVLQ